MKKNNFNRIKFKNDKFIDATGVVYKQKPLNENLDCLNKVVNYFYMNNYI